MERAERSRARIDCMSILVSFLKQRQYFVSILEVKMNYYSFGLSGKHLGPNTAWILRTEAKLVVLMSGAPVLFLSQLFCSQCMAVVKCE